MTTMFIVLWKWPDSGIAMWFDHIVSTIMDHMAGVSVMPRLPWF
jgi:hypothetical protein